MLGPQRGCSWGGFLLGHLASKVAEDKQAPQGKWGITGFSLALDLGWPPLVRRFYFRPALQHRQSQLAHVRRAAVSYCPERSGKIKATRILLYLSVKIKLLGTEKPDLGVGWYRSNNNVVPDPSPVLLQPGCHLVRNLKCQLLLPAFLCAIYQWWYRDKRLPLYSRSTSQMLLIFSSQPPSHQRGKYWFSNQ